VKKYLLKNSIFIYPLSENQKMHGASHNGANADVSRQKSRLQKAFALQNGICICVF